MDRKSLEQYVRTHAESPGIIKKEEEKLKEAKKTRTQVVNEHIKEKYDTPEKATARIKQLCEAIFNISERIHEGLRLERSPLLENENMRVLSWRKDISEEPWLKGIYDYFKWFTVIIERVPSVERKGVVGKKVESKISKNSDVKYRLLQPESESLSELGSLSSKPTAPDILADSHYSVGTDKTPEGLLRSLQSSVEAFEAICEILACTPNEDPDQ